MKQLFFISLLAIAFVTNITFCSRGGLTQNIGTQNNENNNTMSNKIRIKVGASMFTATLSDNPTATAFKALLPMTINMTELNGNEKYFNLAANLPTNALTPSTIQNGDLMMYGANTLVLFYKNFSTAYSYTKLGRIDDASGLAAKLGAENVSVTFELK